MTQQIQRSSAFELLRITAMFMVVLGHCVLSTAKDQEPYLGVIDNIGWFIGAFTVCAVNCFFLLTGYFIRSGSFRFSRIIGIWFRTFFYSAVIYLIISLLQGNFEFKSLIQYMLPIVLKKYWYMQVYIALALFAPFISILLDRLNQRQHAFLIIILLLFFSLHETFIKVARTLDQSQGYGIIWACVLLIVGNWLRRYGGGIPKLPGAIWLPGYVFCSIAIFISNYLVVRYHIAGGVVSRGNFYAYNSITVLVQSLCLFLFFIRLSEKMKYNKVINFLGSNTLAVYLISAHPLLLYPLWTEVFKMEQFWDRPVVYVVMAIVLTVLVMFVCILLDKGLGCLESLSGFKGLMKKADKYLIMPGETGEE